ncbi:MAG: hypothetical protein KC461_00150 [Dehalococcoidia bacterium]|nr:hypothetical protein [Dehalococcoidia bacterium]MCA9849050.1 hypothetical protein [Dehalococcoidia bacterium]
MTRSVAETVAAIRALEIQGATRIARAGLEAIAGEAEAGRTTAELHDLCREICSARPNEPLLHNLVDAFIDASRAGAAPAAIVTRFLARLGDEQSALGGHLATRIRSASVVVTICHSSSVTGGIVAAHEGGTRLQAVVLETRPRFQGRITARELAAAGIPVTQYVDAEIPLALESADLVALGADVLAEGWFLNKVGSRMLAEAAHARGLPVVVVAHTLKFDPARAERIEERDPREVWADAPPGVEVRNPAFDRVPFDFVEAVVTERGAVSAAALPTLQRPPWA